MPWGIWKNQAFWKGGWMINEFEDFKLLLSLGYSGEEIYELSFDEVERQYIYYQTYCEGASNVLDSCDDTCETHRGDEE